MNLYSSYLFVISLFLLTACSSGKQEPKLALSVTGSVTPKATQIYWLDTVQATPLLLTTLTTENDLVRYSTEYRWHDGLVREIERRGKVMDEGKLVSQRFLIRYDSKGQAVYQQHLFNGETRPIHPFELNALYIRAQAEYRLANELLAKKQVFFQGHWRHGSFENSAFENGTFETCFTQQAKKLQFNQSVSKQAYNRLKNEDNFIAAVGFSEPEKNIIEQLIAVEPYQAVCIERPKFD